MLQSEREGEDFVISPKGYEFDVAKTKWVPKSDEVVKQVEESKQKCEEWLTKKCDYSLADKPAIQKCKLLPKIKRNRNKLTWDGDETLRFSSSVRTFIDVGVRSSDLTRSEVGPIVTSDWSVVPLLVVPPSSLGVCGIICNVGGINGGGGLADWNDFTFN